MSTGKNFDPAKRKKLNNPLRLQWIPSGRVVELMGMESGGVYLDVGAGTGYISRAISSLVPKATIHAVDVEPLMVAEMKAAAGTEMVRPQIMEPDRLPFPDKSIDGVWSITLYHELKESISLFREMNRVLRPGGLLLLVDWQKTEEASKQGPPLEHRCEAGEVIHNLEEAGFRDAAEQGGFIHHFAVRAVA